MGKYREGYPEILPEPYLDLVTSKREKKPFLPRFLTEKAIRTALQNLYLSVVGSNENARVLLEKDPSNITHTLAQCEDK